MKIKAMLSALLFSLTIVAGSTAVYAQDDEEVRGAFLTTRPKASSKPKAGPAQKPNRRRPKTTVSKPTTGSDASAKVVTTDPAQPAGKVVNSRMGMGLTLFMRDSNGMAVRTDPTREFKRGDRVRVLLETNADGYLYIFNTTNGGEPVMIYPDPELDEAGNYIQAHVPFEIPSSTASEERLRWFAFDQNAGTERLHFVFTREPLTGVPMEDDLITFCKDNKTKCPWRPAPDLWSQIQSEVKQPTQVTKSQGAGKTQTEVESQAVSRGIGLNRDDPEPSLIMLTTSTDKKVLVATLDLIHVAVAGE
ncbi:MAG TPA: DUF4384 domain-containing protein [Pyrinomonadaceae bacterium]|nr:DUF4384 domain-containing protein [Pyrinomonadaceae bacterium]